MADEFGSRGTRADDDDPTEATELVGDIVEEVPVRRSFAEMNMIGPPMDMQRGARVSNGDLVGTVCRDIEDASFAVIYPNAAGIVRHVLGSLQIRWDSAAP